MNSMTPGGLGFSMTRTLPPGFRLPRLPRRMRAGLKWAAALLVVAAIAATILAIAGPAGAQVRAPGPAAANWSPSSAGMRPTLSAGLLPTRTAGTQSAGCYADYKAKKDGPLRLHYGVAKLSDSTCGPDLPRSASATLSSRLAADGWRLLTVLSIFGPEGLEGRKDSAGTYFLRY